MLSTESHSIRCPHCGHDSRDLEFCDACNCEIGTSPVPVQPPPAQIDLGAGQVVDCSCLNGVWPQAGATGPHEITWLKPCQGRLYAFSPAEWPTARPAVEERCRTKLKALPHIHIVPAEGGAIVVAERLDDASAVAISPRVDTGVLAALQFLREWSRAIAQVMAELHAQGLVWLNFDPAALEITADAVRITNLDTMLYRSGECPNQLRVSPQYSPPEVCRFQGERIGPASDVFHLAIFSYFALANLPGGFSGRGLEAFGFQIPQLRIFRPTLPAGIWPVIAKGLQADPLLRQASVTEFQQQLEDAIERAVGVDGSASPTRFQRRLRRLAPTVVARHKRVQNRLRRVRVGPDIGQLTIAGLAKSALGMVNQDSVVVETIAHSGRQWRLMIVADGVSVSKIGRGEIASQTACRVISEFLKTAIATSSGPLDWKSILQTACLRAGEMILQQAQIEIEGQGSVADNDVMSTTVVIGVLDGNCLHVANAGDSRAYLIAHGTAEQLTVDGDVGTSLLAAGMPPEEVRELGTSAKALRYCLGACTQDASGRLVCHPDRCLPTYSQWTLTQHDRVVLCSDGLVEEGVFLEPEDLARLSLELADSPSQQLAERLVAEADRRQRAPSVQEPSGFGDNIACVVLRLSGARVISSSRQKEAGDV